VTNDYIKVNYVNRDSRFEDFNFGLTYAATFGASPATFVRPHDRVVRAEGGYG
jgi:hypothetical protein